MSEGFSLFFLRCLKIGVIFYFCLLATLFFAQRKLIYMPDKKRPDAPEQAEIVSVRTADGLSLQAWFFSSGTDLPAILYFHGNANNIGLHPVKIDEYIAAGYSVLLAEYRGFGGNPGEPSEQGFYYDAWAYLNWLLKEKNIPLERIVLYGESIGSGVALELAQRLDQERRYPFAVILEAPFLSLLEMSRRRHFYAPVDLLMLDRFMNIEKIGSVNVPLLIVNGEKDEFIPYTDGQTLYAKANEPKKYVQIPGGDHNSLHLKGLEKHILEFLSGIPSRDLDNRKSGSSQE